jgi:hypothetical protein
MSLIKIITENTNNPKPYEVTLYHRTDSASKFSILKNGFNTSEVWGNKEDLSESYGDEIITFSYDIKNPFILSNDYYKYDYDFNITQNQIESNRSLYEQYGGEASSKTFDILRKHNYDSILEEGDDICILYPEQIKIYK